MSEPDRLYLCMGSACYHHGAAQILKVIQAKLAERGSEIEIELTGHFCLDTCDRAVVMAYGSRRFEYISPDNAAEKFDQEIWPALMKNR
ncbi:MAG: (2Fe-2S) ferredoxin domain-containing protein [Anaerolineae bacterium]|nr:(2Fe-2S) ferredoxin domain-containing protein [Anaerolineae bacterium]